MAYESMNLSTCISISCFISNQKMKGRIRFCSQSLFFYAIDPGGNYRLNLRMGSLFRSFFKWVFIFICDEWSKGDFRDGTWRHQSGPEFGSFIKAGCGTRLKWCSEQASIPDLCSSPCGSWHSTSEGWHLSLYTWHFRCWCIWLLSWSERGRAGSGYIRGGGVESCGQTSTWTVPSVCGGGCWAQGTRSAAPLCALLSPRWLAWSSSPGPQAALRPSEPAPHPAQVPRTCKLHHRVSTWGGGVTVGPDCPAFQRLCLTAGHLAPLSLVFPPGDPTASCVVFWTHNLGSVFGTVGSWNLGWSQ